MNAAEVRAVPVYGGYQAEYRKVHRTGWYPVECDGVRQCFDTAEQAENAAYKALMSHLFGDGIVRFGDKARTAAAYADRLFVFPHPGMKVVVERKGK